MSIKLSSLLAAAFFGCLAVGSTFAWSNVPRPVPGQTLSAATDVPGRPVGVKPRPEVPRPAVTAQIPASADAETNAASRVAKVAAPAPVRPPAFRSKADFDQTFAEVAGTPRRENTPAYREKLRQIGWKRFTASR